MWQKMGPSLPFPCGELFSLFTTIAELQKGRHLAGDIDSNKSILQKGDLIKGYTCIKLQQVPINIVIIPNNNFSLFSGPPHRAKTTPLSVPYTFLTWHLHCNNGVWSRQKKTPAGADNVQCCLSSKQPSDGVLFDHKRYKFDGGVDSVHWTLRWA